MAPQIEKQQMDHEKIPRLSWSAERRRIAVLCDEIESRARKSRASTGEGNLEPEVGTQRGQMNLIGAAFDDAGHSDMELVHAVPQIAGDDNASEGAGDLQWLERMRPLSREQRDYLLCQRARDAVRAMAIENRTAHLRFQELLGMADQFVNELGTNPTLRIRLNPIRIWRQLESRSLVGDDSETPADVLFYPVKESIQAAVLRPVALERIRPLCRFGSCTIAEWLCELDQAPGGSVPDWAALRALSRELMAHGIVAFA
jgi:hypothetical protein